MPKVPAKFIGLSTTIGIQQPIGTYGGQIYLQKWCQPMVFPDVLYWPINYYHRYLKTYRHLCYLQKWCQPMVEIVFPDVERRVKLTRKEFRLRKRRATDRMSVCMRIMIKMASRILSVEMRRRFMMGIKAKITRRCEIILVQKIRSGRRQWYMGRCQRRFKRRRHMVNWGNGFVVTVSRRSHL